MFKTESEKRETIKKTARRNRIWLNEEVKELVQHLGIRFGNSDLSFVVDSERLYRLVYELNAEIRWQKNEREIFMAEYGGQYKADEENYQLSENGFHPIRTQ